MQLNLRCFRLIQQTLLEADRYGVSASKISGATVIDFGIRAKGGIAAGIRLAEICLAGLAEVTVLPNSNIESLPLVQVQTDHPMQACIGAQYAGWEFTSGDYFAMASGPARCLRNESEEIIVASGVNEQADRAVVILESREFPDDQAIQKMASECGVDPGRLSVCIAPTASFAGAIQIVARSIETTIHKLHELHFSIQNVKSAIGSAPIPVFGSDDFQALGWTNDAILYGAAVTLWVDEDPEAVDRIADKVPSCSSSDFGTPFLELFKRYDCNFYKMDKMLFSPAKVTIINLRDGSTRTHGEIRPDILRDSPGSGH